MLQLSQLQAKTDLKHIDLATIGKYSVIKILLNKDYLAKDQLGEKYLLCQSKFRSECHSQMLKGTHMISSIQFIHDESHRYQVFPMEKKLTWFGDTASLKSKPQIYCLALLYSAVKYILKPLLNFPKASQLIQCICLQNLWFRGTSAFLFICSRNRSKPTALKTQAKTRTAINQFQIEQSALSQMGQIFWQIFCSENTITQDNSKQAFKELLKLTIKGKISLVDLQEIMQDKMAKKRFVSSLNHRKFTLEYNQRIQAQLENTNNQTIDENVLSKLDNIPIKAGKPYHGLLFSKKKSTTVTPNNRRYPILESLCDQDQILPPSFTNSKRKKRFSLFSGNKFGYRNGTSSTGRQFETIGMSFEGKPQLPIKYSLDVNTANFQRPREHNQKKKNKASQRKRDFRRYFQQAKNNQVKTHNSRFQSLNESSRQKALAIFKKSIAQDDHNSDNSIDDKMFVANLRVKRYQYKKNIQNSLIKVCQYLGMRHSPLKENTNTKYVEIPTKKQAVFQSDLTIKQPIIQYPQERQSKNDRFAYEPKEQVIKKQKIFNESLLQQQRPVISTVNPKQVIDFNVQSALKRQQKPAIKKQDTQQSFLDLVEKSSIVPKKQTKTTSHQPKQKSYIRQESKVELIPFSHNNKIQPANIIKPADQNNQMQKIDNLSTLKSKIPPTQLQNLTNASPKLEIPKPLEYNKLKTEEQEKLRLNFSFAGVKQTNNNEIQQVKSYLMEKKDKKQVIQQKPKVEKEVKVDKPIKKQPKAIKNMAQVLDDQIQEITLVSTKPKQLKSNIAPAQKIEEPKPIIRANQQKPNPIQNSISLPPPPKQQKPTRKPSIQQVKQKSVKAQAPQKQENQKSVKPQRLKTGQSNASSNGNRPVKKQIDEYIHIVNKMGEAVAKTSKLNKKLQKVQWFTGVYYLYKRFFHQRKRIEKYLQEDQPKLTRYNPFSEEEWAEWLKKGQKESLLTKCQQDNSNIEKSIKKMQKKLQSQQTDTIILLNAGLHKNMQQSSRLAVQQVVDEYDQLVEMDLLKDPQVYTHICEMVNALYVMAELDGKVREKRPVADFSNTKRNKDELAKLVETIFDLYEQQ